MQCLLYFGRSNGPDALIFCDPGLGLIDDEANRDFGLEDKVDRHLHVKVGHKCERESVGDTSDNGGAAGFTTLSNNISGVTTAVLVGRHTSIVPISSASSSSFITDSRRLQTNNNESARHQVRPT